MAYRIRYSTRYKYLKICKNLDVTAGLLLQVTFGKITMRLELQRKLNRFELGM